MEIDTALESESCNWDDHALLFPNSYYLTELQANRDGRPKKSMLSFFHRFYNEAGGPTMNELTVKNQQAWPEIQVKGDIPGGKKGGY